ncbi:hypothetical protein BAUCODRAFT_145747 [Baudoinia panamericana UAMH 10762]|uniref:Carboxylic ester hydrolase n=1 Tax=Baudoinia panamericana (strain UAMH 10762) TaxID=717646 RepID=M2NI05_BAUPA|nr:uncharacterized protein BAUCODRAFT_145747 [Baudoinia panamericana UAMH 10762]EMC98715.1 hypothetical protein BAUCODRAFT_145747 [Baudoinia panamericana UAMH 10762]
MTPGPMDSVTTADIPPQFLKAAFLVGHVPFTALKTDPRISYALYIPPQHYDALGKIKLPLLVFVHGTGRNTSPLYAEWRAFADDNLCAVLVPLFPAGLEGPVDLDSYKLSKASDLRSDLALLSMLDIVGHRWPGIDTAKIFLLGFSGGGQFAHRFAYLHPERLLGVSVGAPGSVTLLDDRLGWPKGIADAQNLLQKRIDIPALTKVLFQLAVGAEDDQPYGGGEFSQWLRGFAHAKMTSQTAKRVAAVPQNRLETAHDLQRSLLERGVSVQMDVVDRAAHDSRAVYPAMLRFIQSCLQRRRTADNAHG